MARRIQVEIIGDDKSLTRTFAHSAGTAKLWSKEVDRASRGALSASGAFKGLSRAVGLASGGFVTGFAAGEALKTVVEAGTEAAQTERQLAQQLKATGISFAQNRGQIEETVTRLSSLSGFTRDDLTRSFTTLVRGSGDVQKSLKDVGIAADIARGTHKSLSTVTLALTKAEAGNAGALKRVGLALPKNVTGLQAVAIAQKRFAGQAEAGSTAQQRLAATLRTSEEIIGRALLPTVNRLADGLAKWLAKANESGQLQRDVNKVMRVATEVGHGLRDALDGIKAVVVPLNQALGGTRNTVKLLAIAFTGMKVLRLAGDLDVLTASAKKARIETGLLRANLAGLAKLGGIAIVIDLIYHKGSIADLGKDFAKAFHLSGLPGPLGKFFDPRYGDTGKLLVPKVVKGGRLPRETQKDIQDAVQDAHNAVQTALTRKFKSKRVKTNVPLSLAGRFNLAELRLAQAGLTKTLADDRKVLVVEKAIVEQQIKSAKTLKEKIQYTQQLAGISSQIQSIDEQTAQAQREQAQARRDALKAAKEAARARLEARQFRALGLGPTGEELPPTIRKLKTELQKVGDAVKGTILDTGHTRNLLRTIRRLLSGGLGRLGGDLRSKIKEMLDDLQNQMEDGGKKAATAFHKASTKELVQGLGLTTAQTKALRARLSQLGPGGTVPSKGFGAFGYAYTPGGQPINVTTTVNLDGKQVAKNTTKHQQRGARRNPPQRRGPHAGHAA